MGKPGPNTDTSMHIAMKRKIIRRVDMKQGLPPQQKAYPQNSASTLIMFQGWRAATQNSCAVIGNTKCVADKKNVGSCGC